MQPYQDVQALVRSDCVQQMAVENAQAFAAKLKARADEAGSSGPAGPSGPVGLEVAAAELAPRLANLTKMPEGKAAPVLKVQESAFFRRVS